MEALKKFRIRWLIYCSLASIIGVSSIYVWPFLSGIAVTIIQTVLLSKFLKNKGWYWVLNPILFGASLFLYQYNYLLGVLGSTIALEIVFFILFKRFSLLLWSITNGFPAAIFFVLLNYMDNFFEYGIFIAGITLSCFLWFLQAHLLSKFLAQIPKTNISNLDILDAL
jgi:hypothetical protein